MAPPEWQRYPDPATELDVVRLTNPATPAGLTAAHLRQFTRKAEFLLYWSERSGRKEAWFGSLKTGDSEQLTEAEALDPMSLALTADEKGFYYFDGPRLYMAGLQKPAPRLLYTVPDGATRNGFTIGGDGAIYFAERGSSGRTWVMRVERGLARRAFEVEGDVTELIARPGNGKAKIKLAWRQGEAIRAAAADGSGLRTLRVEAGKTGEFAWETAGGALTYLHIPDDPRELISLRVSNPESGADTLLAQTSQFISAAPNLDSSVFVGASRSVASPYVLILLRKTRRELTLAEHHASDAAMVQPRFSPDSRTIAFVSDRHGKPAVYLMGVGKFVEETGGDDEPDAAAPGRGPRRNPD